MRKLAWFLAGIPVFTLAGLKLLQTTPQQLTRLVPFGFFTSKG
ncbi:hypothetical protein HRbin09_00467 [bacterium HR09]|nr:hypothetical protein HRbin09_00467 [bacterium HR09]